MKSKITLLSLLISASLLASASAFAASPRGGQGGNRGNSSATPVRDGSGKNIDSRANPNSSGTPVKDGSGKATAPGKGAKDGTGNRADCPNG